MPTYGTAICGLSPDMVFPKPFAFLLKRKPRLLLSRKQAHAVHFLPKQALVLYCFKGATVYVENISSSRRLLGGTKMPLSFFISAIDAVLFGRISANTGEE